VPDGLSESQFQLLEALGVLNERICHHSPEETWTVDELYFIPPPTVTRFDDPETAQWLSAKLRKVFCEISTQIERQPRRLYVSRAKATSRRLVNEKEILALLRPLGFDVIHAEDLPLARQAEYFAQAEVIVAPHGAGLTNIYFSSPGTKVVEIFFESPEFRTCYWSLCEALNMDYIYTVGSAVENPDGPESDIRLSPPKLMKALQMVGIIGAKG
jgi:capsular polysaccharide biosynthesis protein